jgi:hypothetical protein
MPRTALGGGGSSNGHTDDGEDYCARVVDTCTWAVLGHQREGGAWAALRTREGGMEDASAPATGQAVRGARRSGASSTLEEPESSPARGIGGRRRSPDPKRGSN